MGFTWSYWALQHLYERRGVEPHEVNQALIGSWPRHTVKEGLVFVTYWGRTRAGRGLMIAARRVGEWDWEIVDARDLTSAESAELDQWKERNGD